MRRKHLDGIAIAGGILVLALAAGGCAGGDPGTGTSGGRAEAVMMKEDPSTTTRSGTPTMSIEDLKKKLSPEEYAVTQEKATEPAFTGRYWNTHTDGVYRCVVCGEPLFSSDDKYDSGCGWPSFTRPMEAENVGEHSDRSLGMTRTEVVCSHCGAHLGHVFDDGPRPTGLRYCINSVSLKLDPAGEDSAGEGDDSGM